MRRDPLGLVTESILTILIAHAGGTQAMPARMAKVMHAKAQQLRPLSCPLPG